MAEGEVTVGIRGSRLMFHWRDVKYRRDVWAFKGKVDYTGW
jgi:hypothetical protein